jgi:hypothetical protein
MASNELTTAAAAIAEAQPKTSSALKTLFRTVLLPILPALVSGILVNASTKTKTILRKTRDILVDADLGEDLPTD